MGFGQAAHVARRTGTAGSQPPDGAVALSDALADAHGLASSDATLRLAGRLSVVVSRIWLHAWPWLFIAAGGLVALLARAARHDRLDSTIAIRVVVFPVGVIVLVAEAPRIVISRGAQLCLVALSPEATALLGIPARSDPSERGGSIPRHPLLASVDGLQIIVGGPLGEPVVLRERGVVVEFVSGKSGLLSHCVLVRADRCVKVRARGRLRLRRRTDSRA